MWLATAGLIGAPVKHAADCGFRVAGVAALEQIAVGARFYRAHDTAGVSKNANDNNLDVWRARTRQGDELNAISVWQLQINQEDVGAHGEQPLSTRQGVRHSGNVEALRPRHEVHKILTQYGIVFDDGDPSLVRRVTQVKILSGAIVAQRAPLS
ncbi:MAG: hypothetical protein M0D54_19470 [Hyphomonadaceae bacterium JAD_PAG50586_4]|nr:MAG: hypothetical protein M0D54_19470 [Hyphomonadaceae bacterium JAD_PAG50586_4]